jgi:hypothetical protein
MSSSAARPPTLAFSSTRTGLASGTRGGSLVKVEEVGDRSVEEVIDRDVYVNINANWVNAKGYASSTLNVGNDLSLTFEHRCMDDSHRTHCVWQGDY